MDSYKYEYYPLHSYIVLYLYLQYDMRYVQYIAYTGTSTEQFVG